MYSNNAKSTPSIGEGGDYRGCERGPCCCDDGRDGVSLIAWCLPATHAADTLGFLTRVCRNGGGSTGKGAGGVTGATAAMLTDARGKED